MPHDVGLSEYLILMIMGIVPSMKRWLGDGKEEMGAMVIKEFGGACTICADQNCNSKRNVLPRENVRVKSGGDTTDPHQNRNCVCQ